MVPPDGYKQIQHGLGIWIDSPGVGPIDKVRPAR